MDANLEEGEKDARVVERVLVGRRGQHSRRGEDFIDGGRVYRVAAGRGHLYAHVGRGRRIGDRGQRQRVEVEWWSRVAKQDERKPR